MSAISITKLYDFLSSKLGKETAENLTTFIENKINHELESQSHNLATKEDLAKLSLATKEDIAKLSLATKEDLAKVKEDIARLSLATKEDLAKLSHETKEDLAKLSHETKEDLAKLREDLKVGLTKLDGKIDSKISESKSEMIKWMFIFWIGQIAATLLFLRK